MIATDLASSSKILLSFAAIATSGTMPAIECDNRCCHRNATAARKAGALTNVHTLEEQLAGKARCPVFALPTKEESKAQKEKFFASAALTEENRTTTATASTSTATGKFFAKATATGYPETRTATTFATTATASTTTVTTTVTREAFASAKLIADPESTVSATMPIPPIRKRWGLRRVAHCSHGS